MTYLFNQAGSFLYKLGIFGAMEGAVSRYCIGYATLHPGYFMSAILASALVKMQAESLQHNVVLQHIELMSEHFRLVTSNLSIQYESASLAVTEYFTLRDSKKVEQALNDLIEGHDKSNEGTLQKYFDERDVEADKVTLNELRLS